MAITAAAVLTRARTILQDATGVRWPLSELFDWINDATTEMINVRPELGTDPLVIDLVAGSKQAVPDDVERIVRYICNVDVNDVRGLDVTIASQTLIEAIDPAWRSSVPQSGLVQHILILDEDDSAFEVIPPNTGNGHIEVLALKFPAALALPASPADIVSYEAVDLPLSEPHLNAYIEYVLARAYSKDAALPAAAARAASHTAAFMAAMGIQTQSDAATNPKLPTTNPNS